MDRVIIVGAGHAGGRLTVNLFKNNFQGEVILFGDEPYEPYERPPLSKSFLSNKKEISDFNIFNSEIYENKKFSIKLKNKIYKIDFENKKVYDFNGFSYRYDKIIFSNGASPKKISIKNSNALNYLRTIDDSIKIRSNLKNIKNLVIIGAGFIGLEIASTIKQDYPDKIIHIIDSSDNILARNSNTNIREKIYNLHESNGIKFYFNSVIKEIILDSKNQLNKIVLSNSEEIIVDLITVGIGVVPNIELIENSKIEISNGIKVSEYLQTNLEDVYAIGDVANYKSLFNNDYIREESWNNAEKQALILSKNLIENKFSYDEIPWFWTDQFENNFQILGNINSFDSVFQRVYDDNKSIEFYSKKNNIIGAFAQNMGRDIKITREIIKNNISCDFDLLRNPDYNLKNILK
tara:strand:+ start:742 stop:1959 length:1218 start_codon:yes stop_codon:yes gene_type:complete